MPRILLETLHQLWDGRGLGANTRFQGADILLDGARRLFPEFWWEGGYGVHGPRSYVAGIGEPRDNAIDIDRGSDRDVL